MVSLTRPLLVRGRDIGILFATIVALQNFDWGLSRLRSHPLRIVERGLAAPRTLRFNSRSEQTMDSVRFVHSFIHWEFVWILSHLPSIARTR